MKITYFSKYSDKGPSSRYRIFQFRDRFRESGVELTIFPLFDDRYFDYLRSRSAGAPGKAWYVGRRFVKRLGQVFSESPDLVVIEHQMFPYLPFLLENLFLPQKFLMEFDDAIYLTHPRKFPAMIRRAAGVIVGNEYLAGYARRFSSHVHVVPTVLDLRKYDAAPAAGNPNRIRIGWAGLEYNYKYLKILEPVYQKLAKSYPVEFIILSGSRPGGFQFPFRFEEWNGDREEEQLKEFDIGVMPLKADEWCQGKCGLKLLQYMALGIPSVATPVGVNAKIIRNGENGFTATTPEEWEAGMVRLIQDPELRKKIGAGGRKTVKQHYSVDAWFPKILDIYRSYL